VGESHSPGSKLSPRSRVAAARPPRPARTPDRQRRATALVAGGRPGPTAEAGEAAHRRRPALVGTARCPWWTGGGGDSPRGRGEHGNGRDRAVGNVRTGLSGTPARRRSGGRVPAPRIVCRLTSPER